MGYKQVGDILRDVGNINEVLWNMKNNVEKMEKQLSGSRKLKNKMECVFAEKSCQTEFHVEDEKGLESEVIRGSFDKKESAEISNEGSVDEEIMKAQSAEIGSDAKEECFSPTTSCISRLGDELEIVKKLSLEKDERLDKLKGQVIEQHLQIRAFERKIRMFESKGINNIKLVEAIRRTGQIVAKNVQNEFKVLEEVAEEVGTLEIDRSLPNSNNNVEAETDMPRNKAITSQDCFSSNVVRLGVKRSFGQDEVIGKSTSKIRKIDN